MKRATRNWLTIGVGLVAVFGLAAVIGQGMKPVGMFPYAPASWSWVFAHEKSFEFEKGQAVVVAHDMLSYQEINATYRGLADKVQPSVVVVLAPNHYERGRGDVQTTFSSFATVGEELTVAQPLVQGLVREGLVADVKNSFIREHGVTMQAGFIKQYFPDTTLVPLIFKQTVDARQLNQLARWLTTHLPADALVLASLDFSHYLDKKQADINDNQTLRTIQAFDFAALPPADLECPFVDSTSALRLMMRYAEIKNLKTVRPIWHDNTADLLDRPELASTTGHWYLEFI